MLFNIGTRPNIRSSHSELLNFNLFNASFKTLISSLLGVFFFKCSNCNVTFVIFLFNCSQNIFNKFKYLFVSSRNLLTDLLLYFFFKKFIISSCVLFNNSLM